MSPKVMRAVIKALCGSVAALLTFGFIMLTSTSVACAHGGDAFYFAKRQALWVGIGLAVAAITASVDYRRYRRCAWPFFIAAIVLLIGVLVFGTRINGAMRWFAFGPVRFQPSEFAKYALIVFVALWLEKMHHTPAGQLRARIQHWGWAVLAPLTIAGVPAALIFWEPDLGTALLLGMVTVSLMWLAGVPGKWMAGIVGPSVAMVVAFLVAILHFNLFQDSYQAQRIVHWKYKGTGL